MCFLCWEEFSTSKESQVLDKSQGEAIARLKGARERSDRLNKNKERE